MVFFIIIVFCLFICAVIALALYIRKIIQPYIQSEAEKEEAIKASNTIKTEFETVKHQAKVIDMSCRVDSVGIKVPETVRVFTVVFETNDKKTIKLNVPQEMYDGFEIGQTGELTLVEGELYSFIV